MGTTFQTGGSAPLAPDGTHRAVCIGVIDIGTHEVEWQGKVKTQRKLLLTWELVDEEMDDGRPFTLSRTFTNSSDERGRLRPFLESWRGKPFTDEELSTFDIARLLGAPCLLGVVHEAKGGRTYANVSTAQKLPKSMQAPGEPFNERRHWEVESGVVPEDMPEWITRRIMQSLEYKAGKVKVTKLPEPRDGEPARQPAGVGAAPAADDDIPF